MKEKFAKWSKFALKGAFYSACFLVMYLLFFASVVVFCDIFKMVGWIGRAAMVVPWIVAIYFGFDAARKEEQKKQKEVKECTTGTV